MAVGGGSTIGLGKAIALDSGLPILAVPTTYAGSEMTPIYGITEAGLKKTGRDPRVLPRTVIYDPELTLTLPRKVREETKKALEKEDTAAVERGPVAQELDGEAGGLGEPAGDEPLNRGSGRPPPAVHVTHRHAHHRPCQHGLCKVWLKILKHDKAEECRCYCFLCMH